MSPFLSSHVIAAGDFVGGVVLRGFRGSSLLLNELEGPLPIELVDLLERIEYFDIAHNKLSGYVDEILSHMSPSIQYLSLHWNDMEGVLSDSIGRLYQLYHIDVGENLNILGPLSDRVCNLTNLVFLDTSVNNIDGAIPQCLGNLTKMLFLDLAFNLYNMSVPDLSPMTNLEFLFLTSNNLGGGVPEFIADLEHLQIADLSGNWFTDPVPIFRESHQLFRLHLGDNCIATIGNHFVNVTTITWLNLRENFITTISQESYEWMSQQLLFIDLSSNLILDPFPDSFFSDSSSLSFISLAYNNYTGRFPLRRSCSLPKNLLYVDMSHTFISDLEIAYPSCPYPALSYLDVSHSMIKWDLDASIIFFTGLQYLDLSFNPDLTGSMELLSYVRSLVMLRVDETGLRQEPDCDGVCVPEFLKETNIMRQNDGGTYACRGLTGSRENVTLHITFDDAYFDYKLCQCLPTFYGIPPNCRSCLPHSYCPGGSRVYAETRFYLSPPRSPAEQDRGEFPEFAMDCGPTISGWSPCSPEPDDPEETCEEGHGERLCSKCDNGYYSWFVTCHKCGPSAAALFMTAGVLVVGVFLLVSFVMGNSQSGRLKILVFYVQTICYVSVPSSTSSSGFFAEVLTIADTLANLRFPGFECLFDWWDFRATYILTLCMPVVAMILVGCVFFVGLVIRRILGIQTPPEAFVDDKDWFRSKSFIKGGIFERARRRALPIAWAHRALRATVFLLYILYLNVCFVILTPFRCSRDKGMGVDYTSNVPYLLCSAWMRHLSLGMLFVFVLGMPVLGVVLVKIVKRRRTLGLLYGSFNPSYPWWELVVTLRRLLFTVIVLMFDDFSSLRVLFMILLFLISLTCQAAASPYQTMSENILETASLSLLSVNFVVSTMFHVENVSSVDTVRTIVLLANLVLLGVLIVAAVTGSPFVARAVVAVFGKRMQRKYSGEDGEKSDLMLKSLIDDENET
eukprot:TRINITY_DN783_c0_g1_i2.p1 TRINITY_DN783_c0_g1~~TRINITY_DN783_c0_g1_i2.p1  ORF type:complete len:963 (-),score=207.29 TRINITY_DN783_c0_g1_i2:460-3348(-)